MKYKVGQRVVYTPLDKSGLVKYALMDVGKEGIILDIRNDRIDIHIQNSSKYNGNIIRKSKITWMTNLDSNSKIREKQLTFYWFTE